MGNSAEQLGNINNWLYGDGGLNNISIGNYYLKNQNTLQLNNKYVHSLDKSLLENKVYMVSRALFSLEYSRYIPAAHQFVVITGSKEYLNNYIKEYNIANNLNLPVEAIEIKENMLIKGIEKTKEDTHYITLGGYNGSGNTQHKEEQNDLLIKNINAFDDTKFLDAGKFENFEIGFNNNKSQEYNEKQIVETYVGYNKETHYSFVPELFGGYNSNSFAYSLCSYGGGTNCGYDLPRGTPGTQIVIPKSYFDFSFKSNH